MLLLCLLLPLVAAQKEPKQSKANAAPIHLVAPTSLTTCAGTVATFAISGGAGPYELWTVSSITGAGWESSRTDALSVTHTVLMSDIDVFTAQNLQIGWPPNGVSSPSVTSFAVFDSTGRGWVAGDGTTVWQVTNVACPSDPPAPPSLPAPAPALATSPAAVPSPPAKTEGHSVVPSSSSTSLADSSAVAVKQVSTSGQQSTTVAASGFVLHVVPSASASPSNTNKYEPSALAVSTPAHGSIGNGTEHEPSTPSDESTATAKDTKAVPTGAIAGGIAAGVIALLLMIWCYRRRQNKRSASSSTQYTGDDDQATLFDTASMSEKTPRAVTASWPPPPDTAKAPRSPSRAAVRGWRPRRSWLSKPKSAWPYEPPVLPSEE